MAGNGIDPEIWGPCVWTWLHIISHWWDQQNIESPKVFAKAVGGLVYMLPCKTCRDSFCEFFRLLRPELIGHGKAEEWAYKLHTFVNHKLNKPSPSFAEVKIQGYLDLEDPIWDMLYFFFSHYDNTGVSNRTRIYKNYVKSLSDLYVEIGHINTAERLLFISEQIKGNHTSESLHVLLYISGGRV
jgi:hypothetical protein